MLLYPLARLGTDADDYHGETVSDPYRWLEATGDPEVTGWIKAQNELTESFLAAAGSREAIRARLTELWDYPKALQAAQGGDAPVLARVETGTGHGAGKPTAKAIAAEADVLPFLDAVLRSG